MRHSVSGILVRRSAARMPASVTAPAAIEAGSLEQTHGMTGALDVVVEHAVLVAVALEQLLSVRVAEVLKLDQRTRVAALDGTHELVNKLRKGR